MKTMITMASLKSIVSQTEDVLNKLGVPTDCYVCIGSDSADVVVHSWGSIDHSVISAGLNTHSYRIIFSPNGKIKQIGRSECDDARTVTRSDGTTDKFMKYVSI